MRQKQQGTTLLEAVIYVAVLAVLFVVVIHTALLATTAFGKSRVKRAIAAEGSTALSRILYEIRLAESVNVADSMFGSNAGVLSLVTEISADDPTPATRVFDIADGVVRLTEGGGLPTPLTGGTTATALSFYLLETGEVSQAVRVMLTVESAYKTLSDARTFYGTAVLRGGY